MPDTGVVFCVTPSLVMHAFPPARHSIVDLELTDHLGWDDFVTYLTTGCTTYDFIDLRQQLLFGMVLHQFLLSALWCSVGLLFLLAVCLWCSIGFVDNSLCLCVFDCHLDPWVLSWTFGGLL